MSPWHECGGAAEGKLRPFYGSGAKNRHLCFVSISITPFDSRFLSYGVQEVSKKHPFCGVFLIFLEFKFLSIEKNLSPCNLTDICINNR